MPIKLSKRDYENFYKFLEILDVKSPNEIFLNIISDNKFFKFKNKLNLSKYNLNTVSEISKFDQSIYLAENGMTKIDRASMHFSLETRSPFLSNSITSFATSISPELHTNEFRDLKIIPKRIFQNLIGRHLLLQKHKTGFSIPPQLFFNNETKKKLFYQNAKVHDKKQK